MIGILLQFPVGQHGKIEAVSSTHVSNRSNPRLGPLRLRIFGAVAQRQPLWQRKRGEVSESPTYERTVWCITVLRSCVSISMIAEDYVIVKSSWKNFQSKAVIEICYQVVSTTIKAAFPHQLFGWKSISGAKLCPFEAGNEERFTNFISKYDSHEHMRASAAARPCSVRRKWFVERVNRKAVAFWACTAAARATEKFIIRAEKMGYVHRKKQAWLNCTIIVQYPPFLW